MIHPFTRAIKPSASIKNTGNNVVKAAIIISLHLYNCEIKPAVNQILAHISNTPFDIINYCQAHDILVEAYSPVGHGEMLKNNEVK